MTNHLDQGVFSEKPNTIVRMSTLNHLELIGIGTPYVESFACYTFQRLPLSHSVTASRLAHALYLPNLPVECARKWTIPTNTITWREVRRLNGYGDSVPEWVAMISDLTQRPELKFSTLLTWKDVFEWRHLLRKTQAWCPVCFDMFHKQGRPIYIPLLWTLVAVRVCPIHRCYLQEKCQFCGAATKIGNYGNLPGFCSCNRWVGKARADLDESAFVSDEHWAQELNVATQVGQLLATAHSLTKTPARENIASAVSLFIERGVDDKSNFHLLNADKRTILRWRYGETLPNLRLLAQLADNLGITLTKLLVSSHRKVDTKKSPRLSNPSPETLSRETIPSEFLELLNIEPPMPLNKISEQLVRSVGYLKYNFPELSARAIQRYSEYFPHTSRQRDILRQVAADDALEEFPSQTVPSRFQELLNVEPPISLNKISEQIGRNTRYLKYNFPELSARAIQRYSEHFTNIIRQHHMELQAALDDALEELPPPTVEEVAQRLDYTRTAISRYFPDQYKRLQERSNAYRRQQVQLHKVERQTAYRSAIIQLRSQGIDPSRFKVEALLESKYSMRSPIYLAIYNEIVRELENIME